MKKYILIMAMAVLAVAACKKSEKASFTTNKGAYYLNQPIAFNNTSTNGSSYSWNFGDGQTSTAQSPTHAYNQSGTFNVQLSVGGASVASKSITIYSGTASYQVYNLTEFSLPLVSFAVDANDNIIDFVDDGTIAANGVTDTVFTSDSEIYIGGTLPNDSTFIAAYPHAITLYTNNKLILADTTSIFVNSISIQKQTVNQLFHARTNAVRRSLGSKIYAIKRTAQ